MKNRCINSANRLAAAVAVCAAGWMASADDSTWKGGDGSWSDAVNWNGDVPTAENGNNAILAAGGTIDFGDESYVVSSCGWINGGLGNPLVFTASSADAGLEVNGEVSISRVGDGMVAYDCGLYSSASWVVGCYYNSWGRERPVVGMASISNAVVSMTGNASIGTDGGRGSVSVVDGGKIHCGRFDAVSYFPLPKWGDAFVSHE